MFYLLTDFFRSRQGKLFIIVTISLLTLIFLFNTFDKKEPDQRPITRQKGIWEEDYNDQSSPPRKTKKYDSFVPFVPAPPEPKVVRIEEGAPKLKPTIPKPIVSIQLQAPLIKEQRKPTQIANHKEALEPVKLPLLEMGATLHCQLSTPATTDNQNSPVIALVTRSLIRDGITIIPRGSKLFGKVQSSANNRIFFAPDWTVLSTDGKQRKLRGNVQEKGYNMLTNELLASDGKLGLPGAIVNQTNPKKLSANILGTLVKGVAQFSKETVRTNVGEFIPSSGRNTAIAGSSEIIDQLLTKERQETIKLGPYIHVPAGNEFYLVVTEGGPESESHHANKASIDDLLNEAVRRRLQK